MELHHLLLLAALVGVTQASVSSCPDKACHSAPREGTEHSLHVPWQLSEVEDFALETTLLDLLNRQINLELQAFYTYESMAAFFQRDDVALHGFRRFFRAAADEELGHARAMMSFVNERGGGVSFGRLQSPCENELLRLDPEGADAAVEPRRCAMVDAKRSVLRSQRSTVENHDTCDWRDPASAVAAARQVELNVWRHLRLLHRHAGKLEDTNTQDFLDAFLKEGQEATKEMADLLTRLRRVEPCLGHHLIDQELQK